MLLFTTLLKRLLFNFVMLLACLYLFATTIDIVLNLDVFSTAAKAIEGPDASWSAVTARTAAVMFDYQWPQFFQFYAFLHGLVAVAAVGFTCSQMARSREFVAIVAAGVSLRRMVWPIVWLSLGLSAVQYVNQEAVLPRLSNQLLRKHAQAGQRAIDAFPVPFTVDAHGTLLQAAAYVPQTNTLEQPTFLHRDELGRTVKRVWAQHATWDNAQAGWVLDDGRSVSTQSDEVDAGVRTAIGFEPSSLSPQRLLVRRRGEVAGMMNTGDLLGLLNIATHEETQPIRRAITARFVSPLINLLVLLIAVPFFVDRVPGGMLGRALLCCGIVVPLYMVAAGVQVVPVAGLGAIAGVLVPLVILIPAALWRIGRLRT
ncbi:MAG: LptF/LptG family permease [Phycisphaerales bacterium]|nr:LptF/LptG family permease [Phycisphaerales bacterium]